MMARVSNVEAYRQWTLDEEAEPADLVARLTSFEPTPAMLAGTAFHAAIENAPVGEHAALSHDGYTFHFECEASIYVPRIRELRCGKRYGELFVSGQVDALEGLRVEDHKTTAYFSAERYLDGYQWRYYLDIFGANVFRWNVFEIKPSKDDDKAFTVAPPQFLEARRYAGLSRDCERLAQGYYEFASRHMPDLAPRIAA